MAVDVPARLKPVVDFAIHIAVGALGFAAILVVAVLLSGFIRLIELTGLVPEWVNPKYPEMALYGVDLFGGILFLLNETLKLAVGVWHEWKR